MNIALWVLQILFAALFMLHAVLHLFPPPRLKGRHCCATSRAPRIIERHGILLNPPIERERLPT
jgi:hypothetical protein